MPENDLPRVGIQEAQLGGSRVAVCEGFCDAAGLMRAARHCSLGQLGCCKGAPQPGQGLNHTGAFLTALEMSSPRSRRQQLWGLVRAASQLLTIPPVAEREPGSSGSLLQEH